MKKKNKLSNKTIYLKNFNTKKSSRLSKKFEKIYLNLINETQDEKKTLNILSNKFKFNFNINQLYKFKKFKTLAIIGMGGSILGAEAIHNFFETKIKKKVYFFNNLNENQIKNFKKKENSSKVLFIIISKSGNTIETLSNTFSLNIIKKNSKNIIVISEKKNNLLFTLSKNLKLFFIEHKSYIGGRYSVLSEVGIIPAYLMGINISKLRSKIFDCLRIENKEILKKSSIRLVNFISLKKLNNLIFLNYAPELEKFLYWCQQLVAESLGKKNKGFLPVISNAPKDHHSLLQLYLDGPKDKIFNIFSFEKESKEKINIKKNLKINSFLNNKKIGAVKNAQKEALIKAFKKKNVPFREFTIKSSKEEALGKLFSYFMVETVIVGKLLKINPYNQPAVEQVKLYTKKLLN